MNLERTIVLVVAVLGVGACATNYQNAGFTGGFRDSQLAPDIFRIAFHGNGFTSSDRAEDFVLLHAADVSLSNGFRYFMVIKATDQSRTATWVQPGSAQTTGLVNASGDTASFSTTTTYTPTLVHHIHKPGESLIIRGLVTKPDDTFAFDAAFLAQSLRDKYHIK